MKKETLKELKIRVFKREMVKRGFVPDNFTKTEIEDMALDAFRSSTGKQLRSFGAEITQEEDGEVILTRVKGRIRERQREQIESFQLGDQSFGQQVAANNFKQFYGYDVFDFIHSKGINEYNLSNGEYVDPETGDTKSFIGGM